MTRPIPLLAVLAVALATAGTAAAEQVVADSATGCRIWDQYPDARKTIRWSGACRNGFADGPGVLEWRYGRRTDGQARGTFLDGRLNGEAHVEWRDGRRMDGNFWRGRAEGQGTFVWPDGRRYSGDWRDDRRTGSGTLEYPDGRRYVGPFYRNRPTGKAPARPDTAPAQSAEAPSPPGSFEEWLRDR